MKKMFLSVLCLSFISFSWLQAKDNELSLAEAQILFHQNSSHSNIAVLIINVKNFQSHHLK